MRLLICTQAVDLDDPVLGFFHRWIEEFAKHCEHIHIICLKEGRHALPENVTVHSLGKESGLSRLKYLTRLYRHIWTLRREYDAVFVHMNQEYVLLAGTFWRLMGKNIVLWRNHAQGGITTRIACMLAHHVCHTSAEAYVAGFRNALQMPVGIDTDIFKSGESPVPGTILFLGRLDPIKRPEIFLEAMRKLVETHPEARADIYGEPSPAHQDFAGRLQEEFPLPNVTFRGAITSENVPDVYRSHALFVNLTQSGSFDKTIIEAFASGCLVVATNNAVRDVLDDRFVVDPTPEMVAAAIGRSLDIPPADCAEAVDRGRTYADAHALNKLIGSLLNVL